MPLLGCQRLLIQLIYFICLENKLGDIAGAQGLLKRLITYTRVCRTASICSILNSVQKDDKNTYPSEKSVVAIFPSSRSFKMATIEVDCKWNCMLCKYYFGNYDNW